MGRRVNQVTRFSETVRYPHEPLVMGQCQDKSDWLLASGPGIGRAPHCLVQGVGPDLRVELVGFRVKKKTLGFEEWEGRGEAEKSQMRGWERKE